jgi:predicted Zn-dependent peptidase
MLAPLLAAVLAVAPAAPARRLDVPFTRFVLPNGLVVILHEDHRVPIVAVNLWFKVGSKDERAGRSGFAHLFEHLMFMGTKAVPNGDYDQLMERHGGQNNASTGEDVTIYFEVGPANLLDLFLFLEADRLATLPEDMTAKKVALQCDVVRNERRVSYENRPYGKANLEIPEKLFPPGHPYAHSVIGSHTDLAAARADDVKAFFRTFYVPNDASLVVAGDFDSARAKALVTRYFAGLARAPEPPRIEAKPWALPKDETLVVPDTVQLAQARILWLSPAGFQPGDAALELLGDVLAEGRASRLFRRLVIETGVAQSVAAYQDGRKLAGVFEVQATAQPGHSADELVAALSAEVKALFEHPPTEAELQRARAKRQVRALERLDHVGSRASALNSAEYWHGDPSMLEEDVIGRFDAVTPADVAKAAQAVLTRPRLVVKVVPAAAGGAK